MADQSNDKNNKNRQQEREPDRAQQSDAALNEADEERRARRQQARSEARSRRQQSSEESEQGGLIGYLRGVRTEMKKVVWPTRKELGSYTVVVIAACAFFALLFWGIDSGFLAILRQLLGISM
ncbi:MAG: preprotein translocase subunit SecE [Anaerovoracaceae bacterium]|jgi:preprotein translocase subunit SecE